jgi:hypothetical protein
LSQSTARELIWQGNNRKMVDNLTLATSKFFPPVRNNLEDVGVLLLPLFIATAWSLYTALTSDKKDFSNCVGYLFLAALQYCWALSVNHLYDKERAEPFQNFKEEITKIAAKKEPQSDVKKDISSAPSCNIL